MPGRLQLAVLGKGTCRLEVALSVVPPAVVVAEQRGPWAEQELPVEEPAQLERRSGTAGS